MRRLAALAAATDARRLAAVGAVVVAGGCASISAPPGGPPRTTPPELLGVTPESGAVNVRAGGVTFTFDEVVSDRADLDKLILLSPQDGKPRIDWKRERIEVRPRRRFHPNTAYTVTLLPGLTDLRGNTTRTGKTVTFSTGPAIPPYSVYGRVFDWLGERVAPRAFVEVIRRPDSLPYIGMADSTGQFGVGPVSEGTYTVRAFLDNNNNRTFDRGESWDSVAIVVGGGTSPFVELLAAPRDTIPPRILTVTAPDSVTLTVAFDRPLDPAALPGTDAFRVVSADSVSLRVTRVLTRPQLDSIRAAAQDSAARAARARDTTARDTTTRSDTARAPARRDTAAGGPVSAPPPKPSRPPPPRELTVGIDSLTPLRAAATYRVSVREARGLLGPPRGSERVFTMPRARPDSARPPAARPDSTRPPAARPDSARPPR